MWGGGKGCGETCGLPPGGECIQAFAVNGARQGRVGGDVWGGGKKSGVVRCGLVPGGECIQAVTVNWKCKRQVWNKWGGKGCGEVQGECEEVWRRVYAGDRSQRDAPGASVEQMGVRRGVGRGGTECIQSMTVNGTCQRQEGM